MDETSGVFSCIESIFCPVSAAGAVGDGLTSAGSSLSKIGACLLFADALRDADEHDANTPADTINAERAIQTRYFLVRLPKLSINSAIFADKVGKSQKNVLTLSWERIFR